MNGPGHDVRDEHFITAKAVGGFSRFEVIDSTTSKLSVRVMLPLYRRLVDEGVADFYKRADRDLEMIRKFGAKELNVKTFCGMIKAQELFSKVDLKIVGQSAFITAKVTDDRKTVSSMIVRLRSWVRDSRPSSFYKEVGDKLPPPPARKRHEGLITYEEALATGRIKMSESFRPSKYVNGKKEQKEFELLNDKPYKAFAPYKPKRKKELKPLNQKIEDSAAPFAFAQ